jgi:hypothetical protein
MSSFSEKFSSRFCSSLSVAVTYPSDVVGFTVVDVDLHIKQYVYTFYLTLGVLVQYIDSLKSVLNSVS